MCVQLAQLLVYVIILRIQGIHMYVCVRIILWTSNKRCLVINMMITIIIRKPPTLNVHA